MKVLAVFDDLQFSTINLVLCTKLFSINTVSNTARYGVRYPTDEERD